MDFILDLSTKASGEYLNTGRANSPNMWACQFATSGW